MFLIFVIHITILKIEKNGDIQKVEDLVRMVDFVVIEIIENEGKDFEVVILVVDV